MNSHPEVGIVLSGGGARCIAQLGVLQYIDELGIKPAFLAGSSGGALVAVMYAAGKTPQDILEHILQFSLYKIIGIRLSWKGSGLGTLNGLRKDLEEWLAIDSFDQLQIPAHLGVTEITTGTFRLINEGPLFDMLIASCSIPGMFTPVYKDQEIFADGGILRNLPAEHVRHLCDVLIGVNVLPIHKVSPDYVSSTYKLSLRTLELSQRNNTMYDMQFCDVLVEPRRCAAYGILQINKAQDLFNIGYQAAKQQEAEFLSIFG